MSLASLKGDKAVRELATPFDAHPSQIKPLNDRLFDHATDVLDDKPKAAKAPETDVKPLPAKTGQLAMENGFWIDEGSWPRWPRWPRWAR